MGDAVIFNREATDVTAEFVDEFGPARLVAGMIPGDAELVSGAAELGEVVDLDHGSLVSEDAPPLEREDEGPEPYQDGLSPQTRAPAENPLDASCAFPRAHLPPSDGTSRSRPL
jgi:hypothetical protein